jgi:hypothetical protein
VTSAIVHCLRFRCSSLRVRLQLRYLSLRCDFCRSRCPRPSASSEPLRRPWRILSTRCESPHRQLLTVQLHLGCFPCLPHPLHAAQGPAAQLRSKALP